ncbi:MAG TPA: YraN family protein [Acidimicrobiia bacterium]|nr:YraN family protein [Acidimicrobiia bacterium]
MGHVPPGAVSRAGPGPHIPGCERREAGEDGAQALSRRRVSLGAAGESFAAWWLSSQGLTILARNVEVGGGEVDIIAADSGTKVVLEVRTSTGPGDPIDAVDPTKRSHVRRLGARLGASRVDFVGVGFRPWGVVIHWVPG